MELGSDYPQEKNMCLRKLGKHQFHKWVLFDNTILNYFRCFLSLCLDPKSYLETTHFAFIIFGKTSQLILFFCGNLIA